MRVLAIAVMILTTVACRREEPERPPIPDVLSDVEELEARFYHSVSIVKKWEFLGERAKQAIPIACEGIKDSYYRRDIVTRRPVSEYVVKYVNRHARQYSANQTLEDG